MLLMVIYRDVDEQLWKKEYLVAPLVVMVIQNQLVKWLIVMVLSVVQIEVVPLVVPPFVMVQLSEVHLVSKE